ncbi:MAG TPA: toll/interleukin-1 receptor domain-containing protein [Blastocatellia bacterium]|nr:toll/interleukin-1 receptor domain-containing protein [Blastocatellia bacterium]
MKPIKLFISYSHKDDDLRAELEDHLSLLKRQGFIETWFDRKIEAGDEFDTVIQENLNSSDIFLLLISRHFFASNYCYEKEMTYALKRHDEKRGRVIPVILRDCDWKIAPFQKLKALPDDGKAVTSSAWRNHDEAFTKVTAGIRELIENMSRP